MATIITAHMRNIRPKSAALHDCSWAIAMPEPISLVPWARYTM